MQDENLKPGLHEALVTRRLDDALSQLDTSRAEPAIGDLDAGSAADRISRHLAALIANAIDSSDEEQRAARSVDLAETIARALVESGIDAELLLDVPLQPPRVLHAIQTRLPDGSPRHIDAPLTPLLDTTVLTNAPGEPTIGHEVRAEIASADSIDLVTAFDRWSGVRSLVEELQCIC